MVWVPSLLRLPGPLLSARDQFQTALAAQVSLLESLENSQICLLSTAANQE